MKQRLASVNLKTGRITIARALKGRFRRGVKKHMKTYLKRRRAGDCFTKARRVANKAERGGMTMKEWRKYNGQLGAIARWKKRKGSKLK